MQVISVSEEVAIAQELSPSITVFWQSLEENPVPVRVKVDAWKAVILEKLEFTSSVTSTAVICGVKQAAALNI